MGDDHGREGVIAIGIGIESSAAAAIEEDDGARGGVGGVPEADVGAAAEPGVARGGD